MYMLTTSSNIESKMNTLNCSTVVALLLGFTTIPSQAAGRLLPFQGQLTDSAGNPIEDGAKVVQFKIYDAPVSGGAVWAGEVHKLSVNKGMVNTVLGSKASLSTVDFNDSLYLEVTVDANGDGVITPADPPLLPRQIVLPAVYAVKAAAAEGLRAGDGNHYDWSALFGGESPTVGKISGDRLEPLSVPEAALVGNISGEKISADSIGSAHLINGSVEAEDLAGGIGFEQLGGGALLLRMGKPVSAPCQLFAPIRLRSHNGAVLG